mmetsp:Transcript_51726/g.116394  ORF Transcript_51726/g.116394 Transcript_51726/m.116394 type:complete len:275 (-) Transcript_51726:123-947(-)
MHHTLRMQHHCGGSYSSELLSGRLTRLRDCEPLGHEVAELAQALDSEHVYAIVWILYSQGQGCLQQPRQGTSPVMEARDQGLDGRLPHERVASMLHGPSQHSNAVRINAGAAKGSKGPGRCHSDVRAGVLEHQLLELSHVLRQGFGTDHPWAQHAQGLGRIETDQGILVLEPRGVHRSRVADDQCDAGAAARQVQAGQNLGILQNRVAQDEPLPIHGGRQDQGIDGGLQALHVPEGARGYPAQLVATDGHNCYIDQLIQPFICRDVCGLADAGY